MFRFRMGSISLNYEKRKAFFPFHIPCKSATVTISSFTVVFPVLEHTHTHLNLHNLYVYVIIYIQIDSHRIIFCLFYLLLFSYSCPAFFPIALPYPVPSTPTVNPCPPLSMPMSSLFVFLCWPCPFLSLVTPRPSGHGQFVLYFTVWFYFAHVFVLLIRFHL